MKQSNSTFKAFRVEEVDGNYIGSIKGLEFSCLEKDEILVKVHYSSLNYKDALSASGNKGVTRNFPHTPGIDAVGTIEKSTSDDWVVGDEVIVKADNKKGEDGHPPLFKPPYIIPQMNLFYFHNN